MKTAIKTAIKTTVEDTMKKNCSLVFMLVACFGFLTSSPLAYADSAAAATEADASGLWKYTGLTTSSGSDMPLTGIFLFKDGTFVQQAVFDGEPFAEQGSMAHAGPYQAHDGYIHLIAEQTISMAPGGEQVLSFRASTEHDVTVARDGSALTLVFSMGKGTVQEFEYVGPGEGQVYAIEDGALALVDGYFLLVQGNSSSSVTGYGRYTATGESLSLEVIRWAESDGSTVVNRRDEVMNATFDGSALTLNDGRSFAIRK